MEALQKRKKKLVPDGPFVAIDFETANYGNDSACAVGLIRVEDTEIVERKVCLIRPPRNWFTNTRVHGITWNDVANQPTFAELWPELQPLLAGAKFLAAHNAMFDRFVLLACCQTAQVSMPPQRFLCTMQLARKAWKLFPTKLPDVCAHLGLSLKHHDAGSDAEACARIVTAVRQEFQRPTRGLFDEVSAVE
jgi:DNA polymerase-3 subunit epsilon